MPFRFRSRTLCAVTLFGALGVSTAAAAQRATPSAAADTSAPRATRPAPRRYWTVFATGFVSSILFHEAGHIGTALALGKRPTFGFDKGRPTVYSGIDAVADPHDQFLFSAAGLTVQNVLDELILDVPHHKGSTYERGVLAGGIATSLFYITIGRNGSVSDVEYMQRTSSLNKTDITLILGATELMHIWRIHRDGRYANFFARPSRGGGMRVGVDID